MLRSVLLAVLIGVTAAGCSSETPAEHNFSLVSTGMTREHVSRLLSIPWKTDLSFKPSGYLALMKKDRLDNVYKPAEGRSGVWYGISSSEFAALGLRAGASIADVEASLGQPASECSQYYVNDVFAFEVCFKAGRVLSKKEV